MLTLSVTSRMNHLFEDGLGTGVWMLKLYVTRLESTKQ